MASAAISAGGQVAGAVAQGKAAKKVAKINAKVAEDQMAQTRQFYNDAVTRYQPDINQADAASKLYAGLIGDGGDAASSAAALAQWRNSTSYQDTMNSALDGVNASAYAAGSGHSGAALKALQDRAATIANGSLQQYLANINTQVQTGANAKSALTGAGTTSLASNNAAIGNAGTASSNAALAQGNASANMWANLGNIASNAYQSSYGSSSLPNFQWGQTGPIAVYNNPDYSRG